MPNDRQALTKERFDAVLFDLDGVLTDTASIHAACWKRLFDDFLEERAEAGGEPFQAFEIATDYRLYVDGKPRYDGVRDFLASRGIRLPEGASDDPPGSGTVCAVGNRKDEMVSARLQSEGVRAYPGSVAFVEQLRGQGVKTGVVSSSRQCAAVLAAAKIAHLFDARVDGTTIDEEKLAGKPAPDSFLLGAERLGAAPDRTVVVEDAIAGVQAARAGAFGLVVGVARKDDRAELTQAGADVVVLDLAELLRPS